MCSISIYQTKNHEMTVYREKQLSIMNIKPCSLCPGFTEYYCPSCQKDLCRHCRSMSPIWIPSIMKWEFTEKKIKYLLKREKFTIHRHCIYDIYCEPCKVFACDCCSDHKPQAFSLLACFYPKNESKHKIFSIRTVHQTMRQQHAYWIHYVLYAVKLSTIDEVNWKDLRLRFISVKVNSAEFILRRYSGARHWKILWTV